jgi:CheY-like chemotaxis protein
MSELKKILYAEDEPDIQSIAQMALEMMGGFELKTCQNGKEAVEAFSAFQPDLLLFDVMMPEMDGPTALQQIQQLPGGKEVPAVFMTAKVQPDEVAHLKEIGATAVIAKPFDPMTLAEQLQSIWLER